MARRLTFDSSELFDTFMDAFLAGQPQGSNVRTAAKILDKLDTISEPKFTDIDKSVQGAELLLMTQYRKLRSAPSSILLEDVEWAYAVSTCNAAPFKHWAAQRAARMLDWLDQAPTMELKIVD